MRVDLRAIATNVTRLREGTSAEVMAVVKGDAYGHGMLPAARAALRGGATWLGVCTIEEALGLRRAGITFRVVAERVDAPQRVGRGPVEGLGPGGDQQVGVDRDRGQVGSSVHAPILGHNRW